MSRNEKVSTFLKDCLADALIEKMKEKPFEKITVDEIVEFAGVGRATYFRHFSSKQEMLTYKIMRQWETKAKKQDMQERRKFDVNSALDFFESNLVLRDVSNIIYKAGLQSVLFNAFNKIMVPTDSESTLGRYRERFYAYGLFGLLNEWIGNGFKQSPQEMADLLIQITNT